VSDNQNRVRIEFQPLRGRLGMAAQVVSLLATGVILWASVIGRRLLYQPLPKLIGNALFYAALAWVWSFVITFLLFLILPRVDSRRMIRTTVRTAAVAIWFAPACILLTQLSPATLVAALALVVMATRLFYSEWVAGLPPGAAPETTAQLLPRELFGRFAEERPAITRDLATGIAAALALQTGFLFVTKHQPLAAGGMFVLTASIVTLFALMSGAVADGPAPSLPRSVLGIAATILLGATLTVGGLRMARGGDGSGDADSGPPGAGSGMGAVASAREVLKELFGDEDKGKEGKGNGDAGAVKPAPQFTGIAPDGTFPGVILWPETRAVTRLVAPLPRGSGTGLAAAQSFSIPFDGRYLLYQWPLMRPPETSILQRGNPAEFAYRTTNHGRLNMDAIQRFDDPVDFACCSRLRVEIWNADRMPDTVALEVLADETSLGAMPVKSHPDLAKDPMVAVPESLDYAIPPGIAPVTELKVVFRRAKARADKSARMSIERFVLLP
jgi:hypothetical protein